jgi:phage terminase large subunit GpA-like protein
MDAFSDPLVEEIVLKKSARVGYTKMVNAYVGYRIHVDPCGILVVQPADEDAEGYSKDEVAPMLRDCDVLDGLVSDARARDSSNTLRKKQFPGGMLTIGGAHAPRVFRRITVASVIFDEIDAYPPSAGAEGDQIELGKKRAETAEFPKFILGSSPKLAQVSRIDAAFELSDQRHYSVPCPMCDAGQFLKWGGHDTDFGIKWPKDRPEDAYYLCEHCRKPIKHEHKNEMVERGVWVPLKPENSVVGFYIWAAYSPFRGAAWGNLVKDWLKSYKDPAKLQVFVNTVKGESWEAPSESVNKDALSSRRTAYPLKPGTSPKDQEYLIPKGVVVLTAGVDVHDDRIEVQIEGYGIGEECWKIEHKIIDGDTSGDIIWKELWSYLIKGWPLERGGEDYIRGTSIDAGYLTQTVCNFVRPRHIYRTPDGRKAYLFAVKGSAGPGALWPREPARDKKGRVKLFTVKVDGAKDIIAQRFARVHEPGQAYTHYPEKECFGDRYWAQMSSERARIGKDSRGFPTRIWELKSEGRRNEAWDTAIYAYVSLEGLKVMGFDMEKEVSRLKLEPAQPIIGLKPGEEVEIPKLPAATPPGVKQPAKKKRRRARTMTVSPYLRGGGGGLR